MIAIIYKKDFLGYPFSEHYIKWIKESAPAVRDISQDEIVIDAKNVNEIWAALMFLGYAWGQQDNGR